jgi:GTPase SAR1 family protein
MSVVNERNVIVLGVTGSGKSWLCNRLIGSEDFFKESASYKSCTAKVASKSIDKEIDEKSYKINVFDTPGIADTADKSIEYLDKIMGTIKTTTFHQILILAKFERLTPAYRTYMDIFRICLNQFQASSCTIVINQINKKASPEDIVELYDELKSLLKCEKGLSCVFIKDGEDITGGVFNGFQETQHGAVDLKIDLCKRICNSKPFLNDFVSTWSEIKLKCANNKIDHEFQKQRVENEKKKREADLEYWKWVNEWLDFFGLKKQVSNASWIQKAGEIAAAANGAAGVAGAAGGVAQLVGIGAAYVGVVAPVAIISQVFSATKIAVDAGAGFVAEKEERLKVEINIDQEKINNFDEQIKEFKDKIKQLEKRESYLKFADDKV